MTLTNAEKEVLAVALDHMEESLEGLIKESKTWTESQVNFFKKMIKQGGSFAINGRKYFITPATDCKTLV